MKRPLPIIVVLFLAATLALVAVVTLSPRANQAVRSALRSPAPAAGPTVAGRAAPAPGVDQAPEQTLALREVANRLLTGDLKDVVANLRAAGFPPDMVRAIVATKLEEQFAARRRKILGDQPVPPYWKADPMLSMVSSPQMAELRSLAREEQDALKQLLGPDSATSELGRYVQKRMFGDLAPEKIDAVQRIRQDYSDLKAQIYAEMGGVMLPSDREKIALLDQEQRADLAAALTPEEMQQYDLRNSPTAQRLRNQLAYFNPSEQEFLAIYNLQSQFDQSHNVSTMGGATTQEQYRQRQADQQQVQDQIKAVLGDQRYAEYRQSTDPGFQTANRIVSTLQLPAQNASATWTLQQSVQQQASAIRTDRAVPPDQRAQALAALAAQADQQLTTLLTADGAQTYKQTPGGSWLRSLEMPVRRPTVPAAPVGSTPATSAAPVPPHT
jgi:hypothetical protein